MPITRGGGKGGVLFRKTKLGDGERWLVWGLEAGLVGGIERLLGLEKG